MLLKLIVCPIRGTAKMYNDNDLSELLSKAVNDFGDVKTVMGFYHYEVNRYFNKHRAELAHLAVNNQDASVWYDRRLRVLQRHYIINYLNKK